MGRFRLFCLLLATATLFSGCQGPTDPVAPDPPSSSLGVPPGPSTGSAHHMIVHLSLSQLENSGALPGLVAGFDAFIYGHPGAFEDEVRRLEARGLESLRYFNVFHTDPLYPKWGGSYAELHSILSAIGGWIRGVSYRYFSDPRQPDRIIDHTRPEVTAEVAEIINHWAGVIGADRVFLDVTFDQLSDWMIQPGERWPWPPEAHERYNQRWRRNMQSLIDQVEDSFPVMINGSIELRAGAVLYESQVWNDNRGWSSWQGLVERALARRTIPAVHVGHHLLRSWEIQAGETMALAVWLLADESYLLVESEGRPLAWAREIQSRGFQRFKASGPAVQTAPGVWRREGRIGNELWVVEVDLVRERGRVERAPN